MPNSVWTESGSSISLDPTTTPISISSSAENVHYLTNEDKISLMAQYSSELATKTVLDETATGLGLSVTAYDNAVAGIGTTLTTAGAPANWATVWPDGTTFGPSNSIRIFLASAWSTVASARGSLQMAIAAAQAAKSKEDAITSSVRSALALASSESIVPNGAFTTGDDTGWSATDSGVAGVFGSLPDGSSGFTLSPNGSASASPAFQAIPGKKYKLLFNVWAGAGTQKVYLRVAYAGSPAANITSAVRAGLQDFIAGGSVATESTWYSYDWTPAAGQTFASLCVYEWTGSTAPVYVKGVYCVPYVEAAYLDAGAVTADSIAAGAITAGKIAAGAITGDMITAGVLTADVIYFSDGFSLNSLEPKEGGADKTSNNTAAGIANQGALATINQANTSNIVVGAVNSNLVYQSTVVINVAANTITTIAQATITTNGGYVKIRVTMMIFGGSTTNYSYPQIILRKGGTSGTQMVFYGNVFVPLGIVPGGGASCVTLEAVDNTPGVSQQYTVTAYSNSQSMQINPISLVIENAKV
jgi:hypothetical protein